MPSSLREHAYLNILRVLQPGKGKCSVLSLSGDNLFFFSSKNSSGELNSLFLLAGRRGVDLEFITQFHI